MHVVRVRLCVMRAAHCDVLSSSAFLWDLLMLANGTSTGDVLERQVYGMETIHKVRIPDMESKGENTDK